MAYQRVKLIDPAPGGLGEYSFEINNEDEEMGAKRNVDSFMNTSGQGWIIQQGQDDPPNIQISGKMLTKNQNQRLTQFYNRCAQHTMYYQDFEGQTYEVMITGYSPKRLRASRNPRGGAVNPLHYYSYTLEMLVVTVISGDWLLA
jgi:methyltransferase-like protein